MKVLITGSSGQDGYYLTKYLASQGYDVYSFEKDIRTYSHIEGAIKYFKPDEIYNLAAMVRGTVERPRDAFEVNALGTVNLLEAVRNTDRNIRICHASSSEMFDLVNVEAQDESTPIKPRNPYGMTKAAAHLAAVNYRDVYGMNISCGIMFNHESPLRTSEYVSKKIMLGILDVISGSKKKLLLGNLDVIRDWGHAEDYVRALHLINQHVPDDYVVATGEPHSVRDFVELAFKNEGLDWKNHVVVNESYSRHNDAPLLCGNPSKLEKLGWKREYSFEDLVLSLSPMRHAA
jgi:GDPmannose 4,6-dehydratase